MAIEAKPDIAAFVLGRYPPPFDGQSLATERIATLLETSHPIRRLDMQVPDEGDARLGGFSLPRLKHYVGLRRHLARALAEAPTAPVLWNTISPLPLGHWRDVLTTLPVFQPGQPVYAVMHRATFERLFASAATRATARRVRDRVTAFVFQSERLAQACDGVIPPSQRVLIPNTIEDEVLCSAAEVETKQKRRREEDVLRLLFVSNMIRSKGYIDVIQAVAQLHHAGSPVHLDLVGGWAMDADRLEYERFVEENGLAGVIRHHGAVSDRARIKTLLLKAHAFLLPTYYPVETQPKALLEGMNAGCPIIATQRGIIEDMVGPGQGALLVPPRDPAAIARAVEQLRPYDAWLRFSEDARDRFQRVFSPDAVRPQWVRLVNLERAHPATS